MTYFLEIRTKEWVVISCGYKKWVPTLKSLGTKSAQSVLLLFFSMQAAYPYCSILPLVYLHCSPTDLNFFVFFISKQLLLLYPVFDDT